MPQTNTFNPEKYLESSMRALEEYASDGFNRAVLDNNGQPSGLDVYEIIMEFPSTEFILRDVPQPKTIIHFELDVDDNFVLGFGDNVGRSVYDSGLFQVAEQEARRVHLNFDVGIWTTDKSGGTTARLRARQILHNLFCGSQARQLLEAATDGGDGHLEILNFTGGHFITEAINDVRVFRMVNCALDLRVFSRTPNPFIYPSVEVIDQDQTELVLDPNLD